MRLVIVFWLFLPSFCYSQALKVSSLDKVLNKYHIEGEPVPIYVSNTGNASLAFSSTDSTLFIHISGSGGWGAATINEGDELIFLFSNGQVVKAKSSALQTFEPGVKRSTYNHIYKVSAEGVQALSLYDLVGIRKYSFTDFSDIQIDKQFRVKIQKLSAMFASEIAKAGIIKRLVNIKLQDILKHVGDSVMFCSKVYSARYYEESDKKPTVLDVQSDFLGPIVNVVILEEDRKQFLYPPEKALLNKNVCISGVVTMHNNIPYIFIYHREQIKVKSPVSLEDIGLFVGDSVTVSGTVFTTRYFAESANQPTVLNIGAPYPNQLLTVLIEKKLREEYEELPETFYLDKEIVVTGKVILYKNKPEIVIQNKNQLKVLNNGFIKAKTKDSDAFAKSSIRSSSEGTVETPAQFPGGIDGLTEFLNRNLLLPDQLKLGETQTVVATFYVNYDGAISDVRINKSAGKVYDDEVISVLGKMPKWKPKTKAGIPESVQVKLPITFRKVAFDW